MSDEVWKAWNRKRKVYEEPYIPPLGPERPAVMPPLPGLEGAVKVSPPPPAVHIPAPEPKKSRFPFRLTWRFPFIRRK